MERSTCCHLLTVALAVWVYFLKSKDQVFEKFLEWKAMVEKSVGRKLKVFQTDNGGEYTSKEFEEYLTTEGVRHK